MRHSVPTLAVALVSLLSSHVCGQESNPRETHNISISRRYAPPEAIHRHSSTAFEGAQRGIAVRITAEGEYLLDEAQAGILWQHAETLHYQNILNKTATALARKRMLDDHRDYKLQRRIEKRERSKLLWEEKYQELARTFRLNEFQLNWETGAIYWPAMVASPRYAKYRNRLDVLLDRVVRYGDSNYQYASDEIFKVCHQFRNQLKKDFAQDHATTRQDYAEMQRFLVGLKYAPVLIRNGAPSPALAMR